MSNKIRFPAIICDIDGLLFRGIHLIPRVLETFQALRQKPLNLLYKSNVFPLNKQLPLVLLTNGGVTLPEKKLFKYNQTFSLERDFHKLKSENLVLNYSPLTEDLQEKKRDLWLITGMGEISEIARYCGFSHTITLDSLMKKRQNSINQESYRSFLKEITGVLVLDDLVSWDHNLVIILDLLSIHSIEKFPIVLVHNDKFYPDEFPLPRMCLGVFNRVLANFALKIYGKKPNLIFYGKPTLRTFEYTKQFVRKNWQDYEISRFYMLGDNPDTDILGGNKGGMETVLVKTGVYNDSNKEQFGGEDSKAKFIVEDFKEAIDLIAEKEGFYL